ncbi:LysE family translocator [Paenibacillus lentus]|uniref:LysE family translocator n=1 Tax=Paenibacillus lentus TaxID=1338368 RepID=A0A3Q8S5I8_9BACL|nr:LysE family transporter [Paenibacillus lentus]AZK47479.1 LysE family translocator [Paenibacillus lentus]
MLSEWIWKGIILGLSIAAPVGPISIICIKKTLASGMRVGLYSGLGAATADAVYGLIAGFGLIWVSDFLLQFKGTIQLLGGLFICYLGIKFMRSGGHIPIEEQVARQSPFSSYIVTFLLTLSNPMTILLFIGIFGASGILFSQTPYDVPLLVGGVFFGSMLWWLLLVGIVAFLKSSLFKARSLAFINKLSGLVMICFGVSALFQYWAAA